MNEEYDYWIPKKKKKKYKGLKKGFKRKYRKLGKKK